MMNLFKNPQEYFQKCFFFAPQMSLFCFSSPFLLIFESRAFNGQSRAFQVGPTQENRRKKDFEQLSAKYRDVSRVRWRYMAATRDVSRLLRRYIAVARDVSRLRWRYIAVYCANFSYYALDFPNSLFLSSNCALMPLIII